MAVRKRKSAKRSAAAKKAARTRKRNHARRSAAARKAARTRRAGKRRTARRLARRTARRTTRRAAPRRRRVARRTRRRVSRRAGSKRVSRANPRRRRRSTRRHSAKRGLARRHSRRNPRHSRLRPMGKSELRSFRSKLARSRKRTKRGAFKNPFDRHGFWHRATDGEFGRSFFGGGKMAKRRSRFAKGVAKHRRRRSDGTFKNPSRRRHSRKSGLARLGFFGRFSSPAKRRKPKGRRYANPFRDKSGRMRRNDGKFAKRRKSRKLSASAKLRRRQYMKTRIMKPGRMGMAHGF